MKVQIQTTQNVDIDYEVADMGHRIGAAIIDLLIMVGYAFAAFTLLTALTTSVNDGLLSALFIGAYIPLFLYGVLCESILDGQTFGKKAVKIKVVKMDGTQPGISSYLLRWLIGLIEKNPFIFMGAISIIVILLNGKGQRLGDLAAGTTVVKIKPTISLDHTIFAAVEESYTPVFPGVTRLTDRDIAIIQEVLSSDERLDNPMLLSKLADKVKAVLEVEPNMQAVQFLRTVVKDYNYYTGM